MRVKKKSQLLLSITRSKAKMFEYAVLKEHHIKITQDPAKLFTISIGILGDLAASINREESTLNELEEMKNSLLFSANFFDSYLHSKLNETLDPYVILIGSSSYYLCDLPGSSSVLAKLIGNDSPDLDCNGLEKLLLWLLKSEFKTYFKDSAEPFGKYIDQISFGLTMFFKEGSNEENLNKLIKELRNKIYMCGTPRELLFIDIIAAVIRKKIKNSGWKSLPVYSGLSRENWISVLQKNSFIQELWPAQHLIGLAGVLRGKSTVIQMPTSAGKTKAIELILRSAFLAERTSLAIIVAPFRALCHEIRNNFCLAFRNESIRVDEWSDALQLDFVITDLLGHQQVLVLTPEKFLYVLRNQPELASYVGLLIFDEGHQFDSGIRGITYELLLTSLQSMLEDGTQKILISAVISNAKDVGEWLNGEPNVVDGIGMSATFKSVGFASWIDQLGRIEYVDSQDLEKSEFFVPRVIESFELQKKSRETKKRFFPEKSNGQSIALYLGLKLVVNGGVAIFCGKKSTAAKICEKAIDVIGRGIPLALPRDVSNENEVRRLYYLYTMNLGVDASASQSAKLGIFSHHGNTPHGIRLSVEHAMRENLLQFVVCTSTLAQGVNLPIRYLIVTSVFQGTEKIKVRDFHNLIGRAGRSGMHTEGSILFADPDVYDKRRSRKDNWRWVMIKDLLDPSKSEKCASSLFQLFPLLIHNDKNKSEDKKDHLLKLDILSFARDYTNGRDAVNDSITRIETQHYKNGFSRDIVKSQFENFSKIISSIEGFLLANSDMLTEEQLDSEISNLVERTLAYYLADDEKRTEIQKLFKFLAKNIMENVDDYNRRKVFGKTLYGINDAKEIEGWVQSEFNQLILVTSDKELLNILWPLLCKYISYKSFNKFNDQVILNLIVQEWISGASFSQLFGIACKNDCKIANRKIKIDNMVDICEGGLAYDGALLIGAVYEFVKNSGQERAVNLLNFLQFFQKQLKYGLPTATSITLYELGFCDRIIAQELAAILEVQFIFRKDIVRSLLKQKRGQLLIAIEKYPIYFQERLNELLQ